MSVPRVHRSRGERIRRLRLRLEMLSTAKAADALLIGIIKGILDLLEDEL